MKLRLNNTKVIVVTVYASQQGRPEEEKEQFYQKLQHEIDSIRTDEEVIVMGDLNGHIGTQREGYEQVMGYHGIGNRNGEGERVLDFCNVNHMKIMNTTIFSNTDPAINTPGMDGIMKSKNMTGKHRSIYF